jgi:protein TonB
MLPDAIWIIPLAGVLTGFALSLAFLHLKPVFSKGYSRSNYLSIETSDLKIGLLLSISVLLFMMLSAAGHSIYLTAKMDKSDSLPNTKLPPIIRLPIGSMPPPPILNEKIKNGITSLPTVATAPTIGIPKPVADALATDDGGMSQTDLNIAMMTGRVNTDSIKGPVEFIKDEDIPNPNDFVELSRNPELVKSITPVYPSICIAAQIEGKVFLNLLLDYDGHIMKAEIVRSSGNQALDEAAVNAASQFLFTPAISSTGRPVRVWLAYPITFSLRK